MNSPVWFTEMNSQKTDLPTSLKKKKNQIALILKLYNEENNLHPENNLAIPLTKIQILKGFLESKIKLFSQSIHF